VYNAFGEQPLTKIAGGVVTEPSSSLFVAPLSPAAAQQACKKYIDAQPTWSQRGEVQAQRVVAVLFEAIVHEFGVQAINNVFALSRGDHVRETDLKPNAKGHFSSQAFEKFIYEFVCGRNPASSVAAVQARRKPAKCVFSMMYERLPADYAKAGALVCCITGKRCGDATYDPCANRKNPTEITKTKFDASDFAILTLQYADEAAFAEKERTWNGATEMNARTVEILDAFPELTVLREFVMLDFQARGLYALMMLLQPSQYVTSCLEAVLQSPVALAHIHQKTPADAVDALAAAADDAFNELKEAQPLVKLVGEFYNAFDAVKRSYGTDMHHHTLYLLHQALSVLADCAEFGEDGPAYQAFVAKRNYAHAVELAKNNNTTVEVALAAEAAKAAAAAAKAAKAQAAMTDDSAAVVDKKKGAAAAAAAAVAAAAAAATVADASSDDEDDDDDGSGDDDNESDAEGGGGGGSSSNDESEDDEMSPN
jgi:Tfp pilus assembly major pilin PilA